VLLFRLAFILKTHALPLLEGSANRNNTVALSMAAPFYSLMLLN
jgi:hypothetical protein